MILPEFIWFNSSIKIDSKPVRFSYFSGKNLNFIRQLVDDNGNTKPWKDSKIELRLKNTHKICWLQIVNALPKAYKKGIQKFNYF